LSKIALLYEITSLAIDSLEAGENWIFMDKAGIPKSVAWPQHSRVRIWRKQDFWPVVVVAVVIIFVILSIPVLDGPNSRRTANEAVTVGTLRTLNRFQDEYATSSPEKSFACQLLQFKTLTSLKDLYAADEFLASGTRSGYRFEVRNCQPDSGGVARHYQITAVPVEPGKSGVRAFCSDESGALWYDPKSSASNCLASRRLL
jgi:hypothetical protein